MGNGLSRRELLGGMAGVVSGIVGRPAQGMVPSAPVAVSKCQGYGREMVETLARMFDQIGGLGRLVKNKTVAIKINMTGDPWQRLGFAPAGSTHFTHPATIGATIHLLAKAGARRIRVLEGPYAWRESLEEAMYATGWDVSRLASAAPRVEFINTNLPYPGKKPYVTVPVPKGGLLFPAYVLNTAYEECDVFVSVTKVKEHATAGITLTMKNSFGITPTTIYGDRVPEDEPAPVPYGGRGTIIHSGSRQPPKIAPPEIDPGSPRDGGYRVPRCVVDLCAARPIHLCVLDAIETMAGGEGPWIRGSVPCKPGFLVVGTNCVTTDAVAMALMGFDPMADKGTPPFENCDSTLRLAEEMGLGTRDLRRIEVIGTPIEEARFDFRKIRGGLPPRMIAAKDAD